MTSRATCFVPLSVFLMARCSTSFKIEAMKHDIQQITERNFDGVIGKFREYSASAIWFFKDENKADESFLDEYNKVAKELKGMAKVTAMNCNENKKFCDKNNVKDTPAVMMYPVNPYPAFMFEGKLESKPISQKLAKMIPDHSTKLTKENADQWLGSDASKPKIMVFSNKKTAPTILKALSSDTVFKRTAKFGFVTEDEKDICSQFKVTKFPTVIMQRRAGKDELKKEKYEGEINFLALQKWMNPYIESGVGDKVGAGSAQAEAASIEDDQPWLSQEVPELTAKSSNPICFKGEGLCVIYLTNGAASKEEVDMLSGLSKKFVSQLSDRGAKMKFMWLNLAEEPGFKELFSPAQLPSCIVFNPHKRLRFTKMDHGDDGEVKGDAAAISNLVDKVLGGDARFTAVPGQKLPSWTPREKADKKKSEL